MILATKTHYADSSEAALLVDIDLAILGETELKFETYDRAIRLEYDWVEENKYREGRIEVLQSFLDRDSIYCTDYFRGLLEKQARINIRRKIQELENDRVC